MIPIGIYAHVPFCRVRCPYCSFNVYTRRDHLLDATVTGLVQELAIRAPHLPSGALVDTIYLGGGTPSLLPPPALARLLHGLQAELPMAAEAEITVETEPGTTDSAWFEEAFRLGVNRVTIGVQSFDDTVLGALGRPHRAADARRAVAQAQQAGFENVDIDLMFGAPGQTLDGWTLDLREALALRPAHLSLYNLTIEPHTTFGTAAKKGRLSLPEEETQAAMLRLAIELAGAAGLPQYETSNFARAGFRSRHNQGYWTGRPYLGLGAGAHGFLPDDGVHGRRYWNVRPPERWLSMVGSGVAPGEGDELLDRAQAMLESLILGLRQRDGIDRRRFEDRFGVDVLSATGDRATKLAHEGLLTIDPNCLKLTQAGGMIEDSIVSDLAGALDTERGSDRLDLS